MFETSQQTNQRLYRAILDGKQYEKLIPKTYCQRLSGGKGNTDYSVSQMAKVVELYSHQTQKVAQKLQKSSLQATTQAIQDFLYWHFQYKRDEQDQMLRSPSCSFAQRFEGIDCKSYSILGASILRELGCVSYFRRVSYGQNQPYSHVYVVVPKNQKTADLSDGYYVIDGTINKRTETENYFYKHDDTLIMKLNHYILNAPQDYNAHWVDSSGLTQYERTYLWQRGVNPNSYELNAGLGAGEVEIAMAALEFFGKDKDGKGGFDFSKIFGWLGCIGGSAYDKDRFNDNINNRIPQHFQKLIGAMNKYLGDENYVEFSRIARSIKIRQKLLIKIFNDARGNKCSSDNDRATAKFLKDSDKFGMIFLALDAWLNENFNKEKDNYVVHFKQPANAPFSSFWDRRPETEHFYVEFWHIDEKGEYYEDDADFRYLYTPKKDRNITYFEMTDYLDAALKGYKSFSVKEYLNSLLDKATVFSSSTTNVPPPPPPVNNNNNTTTLPGGTTTIKLPADFKNVVPTTKTTKQAGFPLLIGGAIVAAGAMYLYQQSKNKK